ncbi:hypothetical protein GSI_07138 [Ganoderma sinense ZZ0214-1]|uniref:Uncharacterized protein n=1 Tax=Ganoderma sinense ZZ0214-1 TaxID=1077348 RepID=A0A2G8SB31_9APHY|nr:hypothetical protein GSI_07138 [Ganoderma sinense ZZ0214-1]
MLFNAHHNPVVHCLKLFWDRVTFSRLTKIYFIFSVLHCIIQVIFQVQAFVANADAAKFLGNLIVQGNATDNGFAVYQTDLRMCETVPARALDVSSCPVVWDGHTAAKAVNNSSNNYAAADVSSSASAASFSLTSSAAIASISSAASSSSAAVAVSSNFTSGLLSPSVATARSSSSVISSTASTEPTISASLASASRQTQLSSFNKAPAISTTTITVQPSPTLKVSLPIGSQGISVTIGEDNFESDDEAGSDDEDEGLTFFHHQRRDPVLPETKIRLALDGNASVNLGGLNGIHETVLPRKCLYALNWPLDIVANTKREDIAFIAFQIWLLGMSLVALLNESIPHIVASLLTHILATAWGGFQIYNTEVFHRRFSTLTTQGACGINLLPSYWKDRSNAEIPSLALNVFALLVSAFLSWRLMKTFGWQTFKRVGASRTINRIYNLVLMFSIAIQLALFFVGASAAIWVDQVYNGNIGRLTMRPTFFKAVMITVLALLVPWLSVGWISVRKEYKIRMAIFLGVAVVVLAGWGSMFIAATFRWTYATWFFFRIMTTSAVVLALLVFILGIVCRINFGKGLTRYLNAQEELDDDYYPEKTYDSEKIDFPPNFEPVPTFSAMFGTGPEVPPPAQMRFGPRHMGPRFASNASSNPFDTPTESRSVSSSWLRPSTTTLNGSQSGSGSPPLSSAASLRSGSPTSLTRQTSVSSQMSANSAGSGRGKRWVIE